MYPLNLWASGVVNISGVRILTSVVYTTAQIFWNETVDLSRGREFANSVIDTYPQKIGCGRYDGFIGGPDRPDFVQNIGSSCIAPGLRKTRLTYNCAHIRSTKERKEKNIWRRKIFFAEGTINGGGKGG